MMTETPNLSYIQALSGGDQAFEKKIVAVIKREFSEEKETYYKNLKSKKYIELAENVHKFKNKISILGLEKSYGIALDYENGLRENNANLKKEFEAILKTMTDYLNTL